MLADAAYYCVRDLIDLSYAISFTDLICDRRILFDMETSIVRPVISVDAKDVLQTLVYIVCSAETRYLDLV